MYSFNIHNVAGENPLMNNNDNNGVDPSPFAEENPQNTESETSGSDSSHLDEQIEAPGDEELLSPLSDDGGYAVDPEPIVDHYVKGKRASSNSFKKVGVGIFILAACFAGLLILLRALQGGDRLPPPAASAFEKELSQGRLIVVQTKRLSDFAPSLYRDRVVKGLDIELLDNGKIVSPTRYDLEFSNDSLDLQLVINFRSRDRQSLKRLRKTLTFLNRMRIIRDGTSMKRSWTIYLRTGSRAVQLKSTMMRNPDLLTAVVRRSRASRNSRHFLLNMMRRLSTDKRHHQILYLSDRIFSDGQGPDPVPLYSFLKKNRRFQIYRFDLSGKSTSDGDLFTYLSHNARDFHQPSHAFCEYRSQTNIKNQIELFSRQIILAPPLKRITLLYRPEQRDSMLVKRRLGLQLRLDRNDSDLTGLSRHQFGPIHYSYVLPGQIPGSELKLSGKEGAFFSAQEFLLRFQAGCTNIQYSAGKIINAMDGKLIAVSDNGLFLIRTSGNNMLSALPRIVREAGIRQDKILFLCRHPYFARAWSKVTNEKALEQLSPWQERFAKPNINPASPHSEGNGLFLFLPGRTALEAPGFPEQKPVLIGDGGGKYANAASRLLSSLFSYGSMRGYKQAYRVITSTRYDARFKSRPFVPGFELYSALEFLSTLSARKPFISYFDTSAVHPLLWESHSPRAAEAVSALLSIIFSHKGWIVAPAAGLPYPAPPSPGVLFASSLRGDRRRVSIMDPARLLSPGKRQIFPMPGIGLYDRYTGLGGSGDALAAALLLPAVWGTADLFRTTQRYELVSALQDAAVMKGEIGLPRGLQNRGVVAPAPLLKLLKKRSDFLKRKLTLTNLRSDAYSHIDKLLRGQWRRDLAGTGLRVLPAGLRGGFYKTYQFFDRSFSVSGFQGGDALYDVFTPFRLSRQERKELALISHRGVVFLLCTRNRHRGWILNAGSGMVEGGTVFDHRQELVVLATERGELLFLDLYRGRLLRALTANERGKIVQRGNSLKTDHTFSGAKLLIDPEHRNLWVYGRGSRYMNRLVYKRKGEVVRIHYDSRIGCHRKPLFGNSSAVRIIAKPILFPSGTVNLILREKGRKSMYIRIDKNGGYF